MKAVAVLALLGFVGAAMAQSYGSDKAILTVEFDNRGSKVMDKNTNAKILNALANSVFLTQSPKQVQLAGGLGQSSLLNHKSTVTYMASGPTANGKSLLANCQAAAKSGWFRGSTLEKSLKKATDTWMPGDSVSVKAASCTAPKGHRKMAM